ncbi:MAG: hypothetical protein JXR25_01350 [Pontiellaceae bacterium]|nr:hypothetical protein [Pontiellaceae bacterium]MBN2783445.1 hypothetical protein [Pontiellaceae bacterium]
MKPIDQFTESYIELETAISERMQTLCTESCGLCTACCCRADICEETLCSAFLRRIMEHAEINPSDIDDRYGWLEQDGCSLAFGRPPICYAFFCDELLARMPDEESRWVTQVLGRLLIHVGDEVLSGAHLVEIETDNTLENLNWETLAKRIERAHRILSHIDAFFESGRISESGRRLLETVPLDVL